MVKLGQQLKSKVLPQRPTRTERLRYQNQYNTESANFQRLKAEAEAKGETIGQDVVEHYQEQYVSEYRPKRISAKEWDRMNTRQKELAMRDYYRGRGVEYYASKGYVVPHAYATRDATKTRPYTVTDYENFYNTLSDDLKPFFNTGETVKQTRSENIAKTKQQIIEKQSVLNQEFINAKQKYDEDVLKERENYERQREKLRNNPSGKETLKKRYKRYLQELEDKYYQKIAELKGQQTGFSKGLEELNKDQALSYQDIERYAIRYANAEGRYERQHQEVSAFNRERQGYTPFLVEEYDQSGKLLSQEVFFQNKEGDIKEGTGKLKVKNANYNVKGLKEYGFSAPQKQEVELAGKKYNFNTSSQLFVDNKGDIVTHYGKTGYNENVLRKEAEDKAYEEYKKTETPSTLVIDQEVTPKKDYADNSPYALWILPAKKKVKEGYDYVSGKVKGGLNAVYEGGHWSIQKGITFGKEITTGDKIVDELLISEGKWNEKSVEKSYNEQLGEEQILASAKENEAKYNKLDETEFYRKNMQDLIYGTKTFEQASKEWENTPEHKQIMKDYQKEYQADFDALIKKSSWQKRAIGSTKRLGLGIIDWGAKRFDSPTKLAVTVGAGYGGYKALTKMPSFLSKELNYVLGTSGTLTAISPTGSDEKRLAGLITAGVSFGSLGLGAYSKIRKPITKTGYVYKKIPKLRASETIGKDILKITKEGKGINKVIFNEQKLSQQAYSGKYKMVSNVGREWLRKQWNVVASKKIINPLSKSKIPVKIGKRLSFRDTAIYRGIPTRQLPKVYKMQGLVKGVNYKFSLRKSGYQKALKSLMKYDKLTPAQAKARIRYTAPRIYERYLDKGELFVKGDYAKGFYESSLRSPKIVVSKRLGITTRGGKPTNEINVVRRKAIIDGDKEYILEKRIRGISKGNKGTMEFFEGRSKALKVKAGEGFDFVKVNKKLNLFIKNQYKQISSVSIDRRTMPFKNEFVVSPSRTTLFNKLIDERSSTLGTRVTGTKKTPFSKTFGSVANDKQVQQVADKIVQDQTRGDIKQQLKTISIPSETPMKVSRLKAVIRGKQKGVFSEASLIKIGQLGSLKAFTGLKEESSMKSNLKLQSQLKNLLKEDSQLKNVQTPQLKTSPALSSKLRSLLGLKSTTSNVFSRPVIPRRPTPMPKPPAPKPFIMPYLELGRSKGKKKSLKKMISELAYLPDFTSRSLGLTETISEKQAQAKLKKLLTGFEIRKGVIIK